MQAQAQDVRALIKLLRKHRDFRVRVQAAFALGGIGHRSSAKPLIKALKDKNPAVRVAAATALGRLGDAKAIPALKRATRDSSSVVRQQARRSMDKLVTPKAATATRGPVRPGSRPMPLVDMQPSVDHIPWGRTRYVVSVGNVVTPEAKSKKKQSAHLKSIEKYFRKEIGRNLRLLRHVAVFGQPQQVNSVVKQKIKKHRLPYFRVDGNLQQLDRRALRGEVSVRAKVALVLVDAKAENLKGMLSGSATGKEKRIRSASKSQYARLSEQAVRAAVRSAMSSAQGALRTASR